MKHPTRGGDEREQQQRELPVQIEHPADARGGLQWFAHDATAQIAQPVRQLLQREREVVHQLLRTTQRDRLRVELQRAAKQRLPQIDRHQFGHSSRH